MNVVALSAEQALGLRSELAVLLVDVVEHGASVSFMSPFSVEEATSYWDSVLAALDRGDVHVLAVSDDSGLVGTAQLVVKLPPNQRHRADVAKVLVHSRARRRGIARRLMLELEQIALADERWLLVLDTLTGSPAEALYTGLGYSTVGSIPDYARYPTGELAATTVMFKRL